MSTQLAGMLDISAQIPGIRLYGLPFLQKKKPFLTGGHGPDKSLGFVERSPQMPGNRTGVYGFGHGERRIIVRAVARVAADFVDETFRREAGGFFNGGPNHRAKRQMVFMDVQQIKHVAGRVAARRRQSLIGGNVDDMQRVTEQLVSNQRKKRKSLSRTHSSFMLSPRRPTSAA